MMAKMGIGILGLLGKGLLGKAAAGAAGKSLGSGALSSVVSLLGSSGGRGGGGGKGQGGGRGGQRRGGGCRNQSALPLEKALSFLLESQSEQRQARLAAQTADTPDSYSTQIIDVPVQQAALPENKNCDTSLEEALEVLMAHITSFTDGRVRIRHQALRDISLHESVRKDLEKSGCFTDIQINAATGSILLIYDNMSREDFLEAAIPLGIFLANS